MDISAAEFNSRYQDDNSFSIIDVREELEFQTFNLGGTNIPLKKLLMDVGALDYAKDNEIVVVCQRGLRSGTATQALLREGYTHVRNLKGGILAVRKLNQNPSN